MRPDQTDQDSLPDYAILDQILHLYIEECYARKEIALGYDDALVQHIVTLVDRNEYKRQQSALPL